MGLRDLVQNAVDTAFATIGDLKDTITYVQFVSGAYDTALGQPTNTENTQADIPCVFTTFTENERDDTIMVLEDKKVLISATAFTLVIDKTSEEHMIDQNSRKWNVVKYMGITGGSLHKFHVRAA